MQTYIVLYYVPGMPQDETPFGFKAQADDVEHAKEQALNAYPDAEIVHVYEGADYLHACYEGADYLHACDEYWDVLA